MTFALRLAALAALMLGAGCGQPRLIGRTCGEEGCAADETYRTCMEFELTAEQGGVGERRRCFLFTLDQMFDAEGTNQPFLAAAQVEGVPIGHDIDLRMAAEVPGFPDGRYEQCEELLAAAVDWVPLMTTVGESDTSNFEFAPLVTSRKHRLFVFDRDYNLDNRPETDMTVRISCSLQRPRVVGRAFGLNAQLDPLLFPGAGIQATTTCTFTDPALITRLFRRDRQQIAGIAIPTLNGFVVRRPGAAPDDLLWLSTYDWTHDLAQPTRFDRGQRLSWECSLANQTDTQLALGPGLADTCGLFGIFRTPEGVTRPPAVSCDTRLTPQ